MQIVRVQVLRQTRALVFLVHDWWRSQSCETLPAVEKCWFVHVPQPTAWFPRCPKHSEHTIPMATIYNGRQCSRRKGP